MYLHEYNNVMYNQPIGYKAYYLTILKKIKKKNYNLVIDLIGSNELILF